MTVIFLAAAALLTPAMVQAAEDMREALRRVGLKTEAFAALIGGSVAHVSKQLSGQEAFTLLIRCANVPEVWHQFWLIQARRAGAVVIESEALATYVQQSAAMVEKLAQLESFTMAKMELLPSNREEKTA